MKTARYLKFRTLCKTPVELAVMRSNNPLKSTVVVEPSPQLASDFLANFRKPFNIKQTDRTPSVSYDL